MAAFYCCQWQPVCVGGGGIGASVWVRGGGGGCLCVGVFSAPFFFYSSALCCTRKSTFHTLFSGSHCVRPLNKEDTIRG